MTKLPERFERGRIHLWLGELRSAFGELQPDQNVLAVTLAGLEHHLGAFLEAVKAFLEVVAFCAQDLGVLGQAEFPVGPSKRQGHGHAVEIDLLEPGSLNVAVTLGACAYELQADQNAAAALASGLEHHGGALLEPWVPETLGDVLVGGIDDFGFRCDHEVAVLAVHGDGYGAFVRIRLLDFPLLYILLSAGSRRKDCDADQGDGQ